jgi:HEAT repeat protein
MTGTVLWLIAIGLIVVGLVIYFYSVLNEERRKAAQRESIGSQLEEDAKELVIDYLTSPDSYQRQAMAKQLAEFESVDEVILQLLLDMAVGDEDEGVRKTAVATLRVLNS